MSDRRIVYPDTRRQEITELLHGSPVHDPYRWLEADSAEVLSWDNAQNALADAVLAEWPDRDRLRCALHATLTAGSAGVVEPPSFYGPFCFQLGSVPGRQQAVLFVSEGLDAEQRVLIDPQTAGEQAALDWFYPAPDGEYVAFGISYLGDEQSVMQVIETRTGALLPERIPHTSFARVAWLPDSSGFYYSGGKTSDLEDAQKWIFFHRLRDTSAGTLDPKRFEATYIAPQCSPDGRYLMVQISEENPRAAYYRDLETDAGWQPLLGDKEGDSYGEFVADNYLALTTYGAPRGRIVSIPLATARDESSWVEVVAESEAVLRHFVLLDDQLVISELYQACSQLRVVPLDGGPSRVVRLPGMGLIRGAEDPQPAPISVRGQQLFFGYCSFTEPLRVYCYDLDRDTLTTLGAEPTLDLSHVQARQLLFPALDGTELSMFLVHRRDLDCSRPNPVLLYGYGGWNLVLAPGYVGGTLSGSSVRCVLPFIEAGGIYVYVNLRGGSEYGRDWWQDGRLHNKQNTFDDFYAAAEYLIASNLTTPDLLAGMGASNGGLLAAAAATQRPDLFKAIVSEVPLTDMVRTFDSPYTASYTAEYGDPRDPAMLPVLLSYSPVHNVRVGERYPAVLVKCADKDIRCQPWNGRKMVALLQHATTSEEPVLFKIQHGEGHKRGVSVADMVEHDTISLGFIMQQLGMSLTDGNC